MVRELGALPLDDPTFDQFLSADMRRYSALHWTPIAVARWVGRFLTRAGVRSVVDLGAGCGKFCVGAATTSDCTFTGLEQRERLVLAAEDLARRFQVAERVRFVRTTVAEATIPTADAYYLYNPFEEHLFLPYEQHLGDDVERHPAHFARDVDAVVALFTSAAPGTYVIEYNGFGGRMPRSYRVVQTERGFDCTLRVWRKVSER